jgi:hypothetical protein
MPPSTSLVRWPVQPTCLLARQHRATILFVSLAVVHDGADRGVGRVEGEVQHRMPRCPAVNPP